MDLDATVVVEAVEVGAIVVPDEVGAIVLPDEAGPLDDEAPHPASAIDSATAALALPIGKRAYLRGEPKSMTLSGLTRPERPD